MGRYRRTGRMNRRRRRRQLIRRGILALFLGVGGLLLAVFICKRLFFSPSSSMIQTAESISEEDWVGAPELDVQLLDVNEYSRPGIPLESVKGIVVHYTANPGSTAMQNRNYFQGLKDAHTTKASSHFIVGLDGEIVQCIPSTEISYASNERNVDTLSIECCHPDETGQFNEKTYQSLVDLTAWLCSRFQLDTSSVIRHYDVTGKLCPKYFVEHLEAWEQFLRDVDAGIAQIQEMKNGSV